MTLDPSDGGRPGPECGDPVMDYQGVALPGPGTRVARSCDGAGGIRVDDRGPSPVVGYGKPREGSLDRGDLGVQGGLTCA